MPRRPKTHEQGAPRARAAPFRCQLVVMAKVPAAGSVKTRLAHETGTATAVRFARHATATVLQRLVPGAPWRTTVAVTPDAGVHGRTWPRGVGLRRQGRGDLGARMQRMFRCAGPGPVVIIGTDVPGITRAGIRAAFRHLGQHDAVVGPATDGGYWLIGLRRRPRLLQPFTNVRWSGPHALADTLANLRGYRVARVATLSDVDTAADFVRCTAIFGRRSPGPCASSR